MIWPVIWPVVASIGNQVVVSQCHNLMAPVVVVKGRLRIQPALTLSFREEYSGLDEVEAGS